MAHPARQLRVFAVLLFGPVVGRAQGPEAPAPVPVPAAESPAPRDRAVSTNVAALLAAGTPRFPVMKPEEKPANAPSAPIVNRPANEIVRLPNFVVREPRVPTPEDIRTPRGLEVYAMNKYLGRADGFSRGVLNRYTLADGWARATKRIPVLNWFEWATSPEKRALDMYYDDEVRKKLRDLHELQAMPSKPPPARATPSPAGGK